MLIPAEPGKDRPNQVVFSAGFIGGLPRWERRVDCCEVRSQHIYRSIIELPPIRICSNGLRKEVAREQIALKNRLEAHNNSCHWRAPCSTRVISAAPSTASL